MMVLSHHNLHDDIEVIFSTIRDGSMSGGGGSASDLGYIKNANDFLSRHNFPIERSRVFVTYDDRRNYVDIARVEAHNAGQEILADALYTTEPGRVITLPVADCIATVVYDPVTGMLGVLHLGRHSSVAGLIEHFVIEVADVLGSDPRDWYVWMSPSLRQAHDRLEYFTPANTAEWHDFVDIKPDGYYIDTIGHNRARFIRAGVAASQITIAPGDTYSDARYFSHRAYREGHPAKHGRMMMAARILPSRA